MKRYDVCIVGAGPAGLASLSAINEPYSLDSMNPMQLQKANKYMSKNSNKKKSVCVVDPHPKWLQGWSTNFDRLGIEFLRSPVMAHPDHFDINALLAYAIANGREHELIESGCYDNKSLLSLGQTQVGLWKLPSTKLFQDFCVDLAKRLRHDYIQSTVKSLTRVEQNGDDDNDAFIVTLADGSKIKANAVVLSLGTIGDPITPKQLEPVPKPQMFAWQQMQKNLNHSHKRVLVVGGGLTAVQAAQYALRQGKDVTLCSRRPLVERHFDINIDWFDRRYTNKLISEFYHEEDEKKLSMLQQARGGGSVPPIYMADLRKWQKLGKLNKIVAEARYEQVNEDGRVTIVFNKNVDKDHSKNHSEISQKFDCIILACGVKPNCLRNPLVAQIYNELPIKIEGGFPCVTQDLEWAKNLFVVGGLASMNTGPFSSNIMGFRRSASIISNALECRCWLRDDSKVLANSYEMLFDDDSSSDEESDY